MCREQPSPQSAAQRVRFDIERLMLEVAQPKLLKPEQSWRFSCRNAASSFEGWFDALPRIAQLCTLAGAVFIFFGAANCLQEALVRMEGFRSYSWALGVFEMAGVFIFSAAERQYLGGAAERKASPRVYMLLTLCLASSRSLSTIALRYINYPTKIVGRSCKLLPTLGIAVLWNRRPVKMREFAAAVAVSLGLIAFALGDLTVSSDFDGRGIALVMVSVCADAVLPNLQEVAFKQGATRSEMMFYTNLLAMLVMTFSVGLSGSLWGAVGFALAHPLALIYIFTLTITAYLAIYCHMHLVKRFGGVTTVFVGSARKAATIVLSFLIFDKPFTPLYLVAGCLVLTGLLWSSLGALREKQQQQQGLLPNSSSSNSSTQKSALETHVSEADAEARGRSDCSPFRRVSSSPRKQAAATSLSALVMPDSGPFCA